MRYIELNPVRAGLAGSPVDYRWSSGAHHVGRAVDPIVTDHATFWALGNTPFERQSSYEQLFEMPMPDEQMAYIRRSTNRGWALTSNRRPSGGERESLEFAAPRPRGRPRTKAR